MKPFLEVPDEKNIYISSHNLKSMKWDTILHENNIESNIIKRVFDRTDFIEEIILIISLPKPDYGIFHSFMNEGVHILSRYEI